jgi:hypothetical protein
VRNCLGLIWSVPGSKSTKTGSAPDRITAASTEGQLYAGRITRRAEASRPRPVAGESSAATSAATSASQPEAKKAPADKRAKNCDGFDTPKKALSGIKSPAGG